MMETGRSETIPGVDSSLRRLPSYLFGRRRIDIDIEEQFSAAWFGLALLLTVAGLLLRIDDLLTIAIALVSIAAVSWLWNRLAFFGLDYRRRFSLRRAFVGETVEIELSVANHKILPLTWLRVADIFPVDLPLEGATVVKRHDTNLGEMSTFWTLKWRERAQRTFLIQAVQRGYYRFGPTRLETGDLFGLFHSIHKLDDEQLLIVYPQVLPLSRFGLPAKEPFGHLYAPRLAFLDPLRTIGVRDYHPEDDFRLLHWKATARRQELQTRVLEPATSHNLLVALNVATLIQHWQGILPEVLEQVISIAASVCYYGLEQRWPTGLIANGALPRSDQPLRLLPGRSPSQMTAILEMLAAITPFVTAPIEEMIATETARLPWGSTLVVVSALVSPSLAATLHDLRRVGRRLVLVSLDPAPLPPGLHDILVYRLPRAQHETIDLSLAAAGGRELLSQAQRQQQAIQAAGHLLRDSAGPASL